MVGLGWVEIVIVAALGCGCVVFPLALAVVVLWLVRSGRKPKPAQE